MAATWSSSRATARPASTRAPSSRAGSPRSSFFDFRQEVDGDGLISYPHPWLMPDFWQFPTVSMGLGPLMAIYQARFLKYLQGRGLADTAEPQGLVLPRRWRDRRAGSLGAISLGGRERLDNLIFVINCNLQRLDGPVRGNGKIIQELEGDLPRRRLERHQGASGARGWDPLLAARHHRHPAEAHGGGGRRRVPGLQVQERRLCPRAFLRQVSGAEGDGRRHDRRPDLGADPRRP